MAFIIPSTILAATAILIPGVICTVSNAGERAGFLNHDNETECFGKLGCIVTTDDWYSAKRPVNLSPSSPEKIGTVFKLFTRENNDGEEIQVSENGSVSSKYYKGDRDTKFIIHGYMGEAKADWVMEIAEALLGRMDVNVITVDWSKGASGLYSQAVANTRVVGLEIEYLINSLIKERGGSAEMFHLIGHSLGSHIAGYAGERIDGLGRITGLDPAGPLFTNVPTFVRLDPSDANFVDVIHTDGETIGFGTENPLGDVDFYPNGGYNQPGCSIPDIPRVAADEGVSEAIGELPSCSHSRSEQLFLESIISSPFLGDKETNGEHKCPFISFLCESYEDFLNGDCVSCGSDGMKCALMGIDADKYPGRDIQPEKPRKFYLKTNGFAPYCGYHYSFGLTVARESKGQDSVVGDVNATITGEIGVAKDIDLTENGERTMQKGESYNFLGFSPVNTGEAVSSEVTWIWNPKSLSKEILCLFCNKGLYLSRVEVTNLGYYPGDKFKESATCGDAKAMEIKTESSSFFSFKC